MLSNMKFSMRLATLLGFMLFGLVMIGGLGLYVSGKTNGMLEGGGSVQGVKEDGRE